MFYNINLGQGKDGEAIDSKEEMLSSTYDLDDGNNEGITS